MSSRSEIRERWWSLLRAQRSSGLSISAFCRQAGVQCSGYYKWRRKLNDGAGFAEVKLRAAAATASQQTGMRDGGEIELRLSGQRSIMVRRGFDGQTLRELLEVLEAGWFATAGREAER